MKTRYRDDIPQSPPPSSPKSESEESKSSLSKRQEQNRAAQRAFRERRAKLLREMDDRIRRLETVLDIVAYQAKRIAEIDRELIIFRQLFAKMEGAFETITMTVPMWSVPVAEKDTSEAPAVVVGALRSSSTDPTLDSTKN